VGLLLIYGWVLRLADPAGHVLQALRQLLLAGLLTLQMELGVVLAVHILLLLV
jgi:hypothetical protein